MPEPRTDAADNESAIDPRVERSRRIICEAALTEFAEVGYGSMSIESIARRAGVGKATVYRHWDGKLDLLASALDSVRNDLEIPAVGSARERIVVLLTWLADYLGDPVRSGALPALVGASAFDESVREYHHRHSASRRQALVALLEEGLAAGEFDVGGRDDLDPELIAAALAGPLFYRRLMSGEVSSADEVVALVDLVLGPEPT